MICFVFMEETNFERAPMLSTEVQDLSAPTPEGTENKQALTDLEKTSGVDVTSSTETGLGSVQDMKTTSFFQRMKLFRKEDLQKKNQLWGLIRRPLAFTTIPLVFLTGFMYGAIVCYFNVLNGTASLILSGEPYNFASSIVGLSYVSTLIGVFIGGYVSGPLGDRFMLWKARRNHGTMEPEHRLWLYIILLVLIPSGLFLWGIGAAHRIHWVGLTFAMGMLGCCITVGCQLPVSYTIDCYKEIAGDALVTVILIRNTMSFAVSYGYVNHLFTAHRLTRSILADRHDAELHHGLPILAIKTPSWSLDSLQLLRPVCSST